MKSTGRVCFRVCLSKDIYKVSIEKVSRGVSVFMRHAKIFVALSDTFVDANGWCTFSDMTLWTCWDAGMMTDKKYVLELFMMNEVTRDMIEA